MAQFEDLYDRGCSLQESSIAILEQPGAGAIWLGVGDDRMHLSRPLVKELIVALVEWLDTGRVQNEEVVSDEP